VTFPSAPGDLHIEQSTYLRSLSTRRKSVCHLASVHCLKKKSNLFRLHLAGYGIGRYEPPVFSYPARWSTKA